MRRPKTVLVVTALSFTVALPALALSVTERRSFASDRRGFRQWTTNAMAADAK